MIQPRLLRIDALALYCGVCANTIKRDVASGRLPKPVISQPGRIQWDRQQVDDYLDKLSKTNDGLEDW